MKPVHQVVSLYPLDCLPRGYWSVRPFVSPRTVDNHRESLFIKLQVKTRVGLVLYAIRSNLFKVK
ncbi:LuxR C-terminal-related transcriptional regulator [Mucilaginibacter aquaedulcis]|uniref:LuxR C-terminal-related transcriptional regulator n=1 Tax=Mucilaginibacter aquaedulcis TaxID=1187081 RepID=UPI0025B3594B|nr:LuxR C-terminal-related transcriptional regulator [Mucilaginibacter aquaedulcis]MDN3551565.1 LuxR C-terminal-related transcriptional regulator [Mucilaginibacter aquaedulcis]